ncbi:MAG: pyruvate kinase [Spirochaetes bacterium]|nr:MAG: pyruvate kinase [Spirochaetota bacterium]
MKSTKIICTIGPSSQDRKVLARMIENGMDVARMNMSHGDYEFHRKTIKLVRELSEEYNRHIGVLIDLQGPKIRTGKLKKETVVLNEGDTLTLTIDDVPGDWNILGVNYRGLVTEAEPGDRILLDDGNIELKVLEVREREVVCRIINGGIIRSYRGVNLPDTSLGIPSITEKDMRDLEFGIAEGVDFVALSFVRKAQDVERLKELINGMGSDTPVITKIEKPEAVKNFDEIIMVTDGIMVARGDLGAETSPQEVPILQKMIIEKCNIAGKPVITATQMLESMIHHPRPTRAEASDVANAIFDGTDAVMLSGETAMGAYPVVTVKVMSEIIQRAEAEIKRNGNDILHRKVDRILAQLKRSTDIVPESICYSAMKITEIVPISYIVGFTLSGRTAHFLSKYRPPVPIIALSPNKRVLHRLSIYWGVRSEYIKEVSSTEELLNEAESILVNRGICKEGERVLLVSGVPVTTKEPTNMLKIHPVHIGIKNI